MERYCLKEFLNLLEESDEECLEKRETFENDELFKKVKRLRLNKHFKARKYLKTKRLLRRKTMGEMIRTYMEQFVHDEYMQAVSDKELAQYFDEEERINIFYDYFKNPEKRYIIDLTWFEMKKLSSKDKFMIDFLNKDTKGYLYYLIRQPSAWADMVNELFLIICKKLSEPVLFSEYIKDYHDIDTAKYIKNYLKNKNKGNTKQDIPFKDIPNNINEFVEHFGIDVMIMWASSKEFRNLLQWKSYDSSKYKLTSYFDCVYGLPDYTQETALILNKLVGRNIIMTYYQRLYPFLKGIEKDYSNVITEFLKVLMECCSNYLCCDMIRFFGNEMSMIQDKADRFKVNRLKLYTIYLQDIIPVVNKDYAKLVSFVFEKIHTYFTFENWAHWIFDEKEYNDFVDQNMCNFSKESVIIEDSPQMQLVVKTVLENCCKRYMYELRER